MIGRPEIYGKDIALLKLLLQPLHDYILSVTQDSRFFKKDRLAVNHFPACSFEAFKFFGELSKKANFARTKICLFAGTQALRVRSFASRRSKRYLSCLRRDSGRLYFLNTYWGHCGLQPPAPGRKPQAKLNPYYISKKPADQGWRRMSPAPKRGEWSAGDVGAPTGAAP